jgi:ubiquinone/menaquinone biosynthesis C-methylase UbiE
MAPATRDRWAEWLLERRFGGDQAVKEQFLAELADRRERVLDNAALAEGETVLDVGCGDGLIAFGALDRGAGTVVFSDISSDLLDECRRLAAELGVAERCRFVEAPAEALTPIEDESVDVVTTRSVLIYVADKSSAFGEFRRVLRPGGRISLYEPINRFGTGEMRRRGRYMGYDAAPVEQEAAKLRAMNEEIQPLESDPMVDFDERDLLALAEEAGFFPLHLELQAEITASEPRRFETFLNQSGNPKIPTLAEAMDAALTPEERERFIAHLRPQVEGGRSVWRMAHAFLWAEKTATRR